MSFDIYKSANEGVTVAIVGHRGSGKTTLIRHTIEALQRNAVNYNVQIYGKTFPFQTVVCCLQDTWEDDYKPYARKLGIRHSLVSFKKGKYYYTKQKIAHSLVILEDIPARINNPKSRKSFETMLKSLLSRSRRKRSSNVFIFVSQYLSVIPQDIIPEISHFVFMERGFNRSTLEEAFPKHICRKIAKHAYELTKYEYFIFDAERKIITRPYSTKQPIALVNALCLNGNVGEITLEAETEQPQTINVNTKKARILAYLRKHPFADTYEIAKKLGVDPQYVINVRAQAKKMGILPTKLDAYRLILRTKNTTTKTLTIEIPNTNPQEIEKRRKQFLEKLKELGVL